MSVQREDQKILGTIPTEYTVSIQPVLNMAFHMCDAILSSAEKSLQFPRSPFPSMSMTLE